MASTALTGKVAVIGGGAKNLGGLISRTFGADGAAVVIHYNSDATRSAAEETMQAVKAAGGDAFTIQGDLTKVAEVVRDLWRREKDRGLSAGEKRMLAKARQILVSELALAEGTDEDKAEVLLDEVLATAS